MELLHNANEVFETTFEYTAGILGGVALAITVFVIILCMGGQVVRYLFGDDNGKFR